MSREIKFRAWNKNEKYMLKIFDNTVGEDWFLPALKDKWEVMEYTGLKDKNGKEIYEKDYVKLGDKIYIVVFRSGCFMFDNVNNGKNDKRGFEIWDTIACHKLTEFSLLLEIIGNIHEGKEVAG